MSKIRYHSLDSLRGLASFQVLIGHCFVSLPILMWLVYPDKKAHLHNLKFFLTYSPIHFFWSATPAVMVFFVLSGFVLSLPYYGNNSTRPDYLKFFFKRIIRLYLPCLFVILLSSLLKYILYNPDTISAFSDWVKTIWTHPENKNEWIGRLLLRDEANNLNPALWTLPVEIKLSLILPIYIYLLNRLGTLWNFGAVLLFTIIFHLLSKLGLKYMFPEFNTLFYFTFFLWGTLICKYRDKICNWIDNLSWTWFSLFLALSLIIYTYDYTLWWLPGKVMSILIKFHEYVSGIAAAMFMIIVLSRQAYKVFNSKILMFLGRISFSLYLIHPIIIVSMAYLLYPYFNEYVIVLMAFLLSAPLSVIFNKYIEIPSLNFANRVAGYNSIRLKKDNYF